MQPIINIIKPSVVFRWIVFILLSFAMFGNYYIYDSISPLASMLKAQLHFSDANIGLLNAIYSIPNIFLVLAGGLLIDYLGTRKALVLFTILIVIGSLVTVIKGDIIIMATGRLLFGLGAESMIIAINTGLVRWFKGKQLSFAFGLNLTIGRLGSFLALNSSSWAGHYYNMGWSFPLWIAFIMSMISLVSVVLYLFIDRYAEKRFNLNKEGKQEKVQLSSIFQFKASFWAISLLCVSFYSAMFPFQTFAVKFFEDVYHSGLQAGGFLSSILTVSAMLLTPFFGLLADKVHRKSVMMLIGSLLIVPVYLMMGYKVDLNYIFHLPSILHIVIPFFSIDTLINSSLLLPMVLMGIAFSLIPAVMWPAVSFVVEPKSLGSAYGIITMMQNIGLAGFNLLIGFLNDNFHASNLNPTGYLPGMWAFSICGILGVIFSFLLMQKEKNNI